MNTNNIYSHKTTTQVNAIKIANEDCNYAIAQDGTLIKCIDSADLAALLGQTIVTNIDLEQADISTFTPEIVNKLKLNYLGTYKNMLGPTALRNYVLMSDIKFHGVTYNKNTNPIDLKYGDLNNDGSISIGDVTSAYSIANNQSVVTLHDAVVSIGYAAFYGNSTLEEITLPASLTKIDSAAFEECSNLSKVTINAVLPPTIGTEIFYVEGAIPSATDLEIYVPAESVDIYKNNSEWSEYATLIKPIA